jgi:8-oxo-dGTP diphosphatase
MSETKHYVAGLMFSYDRQQVALIRKQKPEWQRGKLNGVGGKVEAGETAIEAMAREFKEETGCQTAEESWKLFCVMHGNNDGGEGSFRVDFFTNTGPLSYLVSTEEEKIEIIQTDSVHATRGDMIENLAWLIALAIDHMHDGRPAMVEVIYH